MSTTVDLGKITASVTVGTTTTGAAGTNASVSNSGTTQDAVLNFTIPRGAQGVQGPQGSTGPQGPAGPTGPQGPMGDVAVITPEQQAAFTMYSVPGQNTDGPMTQKAVTDALVAEAISYDNSGSGLTPENVQGALDEISQDMVVNGDTLNPATFTVRQCCTGENNWQYGNKYQKHIVIPVPDGAKSVVINASSVSSLYYLLKSYTQPSNGDIPDWCDGIYSGRKQVSLSQSPYTQSLPSNCKYIAFTVGTSQSASQRLPTSVYFKFSLSDKVEEVDERLRTVEEKDYVETTTGADDLEISDENGNTLVKFSNGHVRTKNFNSEELSTDFLHKLKGKKFSILGDSISTYSGYLVSDKSGYDGAAYNVYYPHSGNDLNAVSKTWWSQLAELSGMTVLNNCAWSGSNVTGDSTSTSTAAAGCSTRRVSDLGYGGTNPDIIIIFIGINDLMSRNLGTWTQDDEIPSEGTITTFREAYALMVKKVMTAYPAAEVFVSTILETSASNRDTSDDSAYPAKNATTGCTVGQWNTAIRDVAKAFGAKLLDMHACGINYWNIASYTGDETHPNAAGATLMAKQAYSEILRKTKLIY